MEVDKKDSKKSIVFGITKLDLGGAERVLVDMCNKLYLEYDITILTIYSGGILEKELNKNIKIVNIFKKQNMFTPIFFLIFGSKVFNKFIKNKYDTEIAFLEGPITRLFRFKDNSRKVAWVHNDIDLVFGKGIKALLKKVIDKNVYKKYDLIVFVSKDNQKSVNRLYGIKFNEKVIYNYIDKERILKYGEEEIDDERYSIALRKKYNEKINKENEENKSEKSCALILTVVRLTKQKGIDRLIKVHKRLIDEGIDNNIFVIGDGEEKESLNKLINDLKVSNTFFLLGKKENPYPYIKSCDIFVLLSYYEGYGMVIEEAKIFNKKIVITNTAAKEAVEGYKFANITDNNEEDIYRRLKNEIININSNIQ